MLLSVKRQLPFKIIREAFWLSDSEYEVCTIVSSRSIYIYTYVKDAMGDRYKYVVLLRNGHILPT